MTEQAAKQPTAQDQIDRFDREKDLIGFSSSATGRPVIESGKQWYAAQANRYTGEAMSREEIKADIKETYEINLRKVPSDNPSGDLLMLRSLEMMGVANGVSVGDILPPKDASHFQDMVNESLTMTAIEKFHGTNAFGSEAHNLEAIAYCLKESGHDMNSDATYKLLDPDMTKKKFDGMVAKAGADVQYQANPAAEFTARASATAPKP